jgi:hypothetical protein
MGTLNNIVSAPSAVINAFAGVQRQFGDVMTVSYDSDLRWNYQLADGTSPDFLGKVQVDVLEHGADAVTRTEVVYYREDLTLKEVIIALWQALASVPVNDKDEIERQFLFFHKGDHKFLIWKWFEEAHPDFSVAAGGFV